MCKVADQLSIKELVQTAYDINTLVHTTCGAYYFRNSEVIEYSRFTQTCSRVDLLKLQPRFVCKRWPYARESIRTSDIGTINRTCSNGTTIKSGESFKKSEEHH